MTWIRFDRGEPPAPTSRLMRIPGAPSALTGFPGQKNLVIFFAHSLECAACRKAIGEFSRMPDEFTRRDAVMLAIVPQTSDTKQSVLDPFHLLVDPDGGAREELGRLLEFDTQGKLLLVILNAECAPRAAWVGDDPGASDELLQRTLQRLDYMALECPE